MQNAEKTVKSSGEIESKQTCESPDLNTNLGLDTVVGIQERVLAGSMGEQPRPTKWTIISWVAIAGCLLSPLAFNMVMYYSVTKPNDVMEVLFSSERVQPKDVLKELKELREDLELKTEDRFHRKEFEEFLDLNKNIVKKPPSLTIEGK